MLNYASHHKRASKLLKGFNRTLSLTIEPPHCHRPQSRWEHLAHQGFILWVNNHSLVKVANMLHRVWSVVIQSKCWLSKPLRKFSSFNPMGKRWLRDLIQSPAHSIIAQTFTRRTLLYPSIMVTLVTQKRLTGRSPGLGVVAIITIIIRRGARTWRSSPTSLAA